MEADHQEDQRIPRRAREDRIVVQRDIARRMPRQPQPVTHRIDNERDEHEEIGCQQHDAPDLRRRQARRQRRTWYRGIGGRKRDCHIATLEEKRRPPPRRRPCESRDPYAPPEVLTDLLHRLSYTHTHLRLSPPPSPA